MTDQIERRLLEAHVATKAKKLVGLATRFGVPAKIAGQFTETIQPGAFTRTLEDGHDILALVDHDPSKLLARTRNGSLRLHQDELGLAFEIDLPDTQLANDIRALAAAGTLGGMSFGFRIPRGGERWNGARTERTLTNIELVEISVIHSHAAYTGTSVSARSQTNVRSDLARRVALIELGGRDA